MSMDLFYNPDAGMNSMRFEIFTQGTVNFGKNRKIFC